MNTQINTEQVKEILLKQMELIQEESEKGEGFDKAGDLAELSSVLAELANAYAKLYFMA